MDSFSKQQRSKVMAKVRGHKNKSTELKLLKLFRDHGITGWRRNQKLFGKPDFIFRRTRVVVFVDGCFGTDVLSVTGVLNPIANIGTVNLPGIVVVIVGCQRN
jgi:DNA mismatch endonuclease Vsr